jgi:hypothetical protein
MGRLLMFLAGPLLAVALWQVHHQHQQGAGWLPQQQAITQAAAELHRGVCQ